MDDMHRLPPRRLKALLVALPLFLAGCGAYENVPEIGQVHPLTVESYEVSFPISQGETGRWHAGSGESLRTIAQGYLETGSGMLAIEGDGPAVQAVRESLEMLGVSGERIAPMIVQRGQPSRAQIFFTALAVRLPDCSPPGSPDSFWEYVDLTDLALPGYTTPPNGDHGCATQRNFGAMIARPADLLRPTRPQRGMDTVRNDALFKTYRETATIQDSEVRSTEIE